MRSKSPPCKKSRTSLRCKKSVGNPSSMRLTSSRRADQVTHCEVRARPLHGIASWAGFFCSLALSEPVTKAVRRDHVKDLPRGSVVLFDTKSGRVLGQAVCL